MAIMRVNWASWACMRGQQFVMMAFRALLASRRVEGWGIMNGSFMTWEIIAKRF